MADGPDPVRLIRTGGRPDAAPGFDRIAIIGLGLMGGSLALAARRAWPDARVSGGDRHDVLEAAMRLHAVVAGADDPVVAAEADLLVLAAPVAENARLVGELPALLAGNAIVTDLGSAKRVMVEAAIGMPERLTFIGGHPLAGAPRSGIEFARPDLFAGRPWILVPGTAPPDATLRLEAFVAGVGGVPRIMTAEQHDHLLAYLSHLPQLVVSALMQVIGEELGEDGLALSGRGLQDATRMASSPGSTWKDVYAANADEVATALETLCETLNRVRTRLDRGDVIAGLFESANYWRKALPE
ncbi:MAG: prephenate dehydrogenase/arogenate dehydrogenase family protein [Acidobacteriota bacterium]